MNLCLRCAQLTPWWRDHYCPPRSWTSNTPNWDASSPSPAPLPPRASEAPTEPHDAASEPQSARAGSAGEAS